MSSLNWKRIIIGGLAIAVVITLIAFTGGIGPKLDLIAVGTPLSIFLILVVLIVNTYYQKQILDTLRSIQQQEQEPYDGQELGSDE